MTPELSLLAWATVLGLLHMAATGQVVILQHGMGYALGSREEQKPLTGAAGRIDRAFKNYMTTFPFFAAAVLIAHVAGRHSAMTVWGAHLYFWSRLVYVGVYGAGIAGLRTAVFVASIVGIVLILLALT